MCIRDREKEVFIRERGFLLDLGLAGFLTLRYTSSATRQLDPFAFDPYNDREAGVGLVARYTFDFPVKQAQLDQSRAELDKLKAQQKLIAAAIRLEVTKVHGELVMALGQALGRGRLRRVRSGQQRHAGPDRGLHGPRPGLGRTGAELA